MKKVIILLLIFFTNSKILALNVEDIEIVTEVLPPLSYLDENGNMKGILIERVNKLREKLKIKNKIELLPWARALQNTSKKDGTMLFALAKTKERENIFKFCCVVFKARQYLFKLKSRKDIKIKDYSDAKKYSIGVVRDDIKHKVLEESGFTNLDIANSQELNFKKFIGNRTDLFAANELSLSYQLKQINMSINDVEKLVEIKGIDPNRYIAFNKNTDDKVIIKVKNALEKIYDSEKE
nr:transporter substrate-binding domain-containing protein [Pigmentibacter ruber]